MKQFIADYQKREELRFYDYKSLSQNLKIFHKEDLSLIKHSLQLVQKYMNIFNFSTSTIFNSGGIVELIKYSVRSQIQLNQALSLPLAENKYGSDYSEISSDEVKCPAAKSKMAQLEEWSGKFEYFNEVQKEAGKALHYFHLLTRSRLLINMEPEIAYFRFGIDAAVFEKLQPFGIPDKVFALFKKDCEIFSESLDILDKIIARYKKRIIV